jgi:phospholipase A-2-activating protein
MLQYGVFWLWLLSFTLLVIFSNQASADKTIKMWRGASLIKTIQAHSDAVRGLVAVPNVGFASCSNDGSLRVWTVKGDLVQEMFGHSSFVYSISILPDGRLLSSGEDRTARIWNGANVYQTMTQPCVSVWTICAMPKGDVIVGGSDGYIRIFTNVKERLASEAEILAFNQSVENSSIPSNQVGDVDKNKLPGVEALNQIGKKEGEVKMVRIGDVVEAHQWSNAESKWIKIGEVVDAIGSSRKTSYNGQEYDFVFDVDIKDGHPPLKLPYNASQNPYQAAQEFIHRNELPQSYLDQVANFILQNTSGVTLGASTAEGADPLTGGSRYVPGSGSQSVGGLAKPVSSKSKHFPMTSYAFLRTANMNALLAKLIQFNSDIKQSLEYADLFIKSEQEKQISDIIADIQKQKLTLNFEDWNTVLTMAFKWPVEKRFPALDLLRLIVLYATPPEDFVDLFFKGLLSNIPRPPHNLTKPQETNLMLSLRVLANMFGSPEGLNLIEYRIVEILEQFDDICGSTTNSNIHIAFGTLVYK